jgi:cytochrome c oxidase assembly protein subunit 15
MSDTPTTPAKQRGLTAPHALALLAAALTWPLLLVGGSVSVYRVGMAVPDWPTTFGMNMFLYDFMHSSQGVFLEHTHRLFGSLVGAVCIVLAVWFTFSERRHWLKVMGWVTLLAVIIQGVLGGMRVRMVSTDLAFLHGCTAQFFFGWMVALCVFTGKGWTSAPAEPEIDDTRRFRRRGLAALVLIFMQIVAGAWVRHYATPFAMIFHAFLATSVFGHVLPIWTRVERDRTRLRPLLASARTMAVAVSLQILLGVQAWLMLRPFNGIPRRVSYEQALVRILHQGIGAILLGAAVVFTLRAFRLLRPASKQTARQEQAERLEVVA